MPSRIASDFGSKGWYPPNATLLRQVIEEHVIECEPVDAKCVIAPHAGYRWCAETFSKTMSYVPDDYKLVVLIGPSHRVRFTDNVLLTNKTHITTPLGACELTDSSVLQDIGTIDNNQHTLEHSIHMHIPYIQRFIPGCVVLPIIVSKLTNSYISVLVNKLKTITNDRSLLMISSDFTHYGDKFNYTPFVDNIKDNITSSDKNVVDIITSLNYNKYEQHMNENASTICGKEAIRVAMRYLDGESTAKFVSYTMSGDISNDYSNSVSYAGIIFHE